MRFEHPHLLWLLLLVVPLVTAGITCFYMFRMWFMTFTGEPKDHHAGGRGVEADASRARDPRGIVESCVRPDACQCVIGGNEDLC